jgi:ADP-ribose pyrophosphatase
MDMKPWITRARRTVLSQPPWLEVEYLDLELPDGRLILDWPWVTTPDYVNVVAVASDGRFLLFRQMKYALPEPSLALVGGYLEHGENPLIAAQRELLEETGYTSTDWLDLGSYRVDPNRGIATGYLYLARQVTLVTEPTADDLEEQEIVFLERADLEYALDRGEFKVLAWAAAVSLALRALG